ncbi:MAG: o-succinylbenzoate synthase [bacterium]|nr:o-succinylbenzoate synthase [bacterium]MCY3952575.1 o-succinylbenzoate synthase [bacterium]MCY4101949.1 o-succinylbenzoate synthase [bacterium]
MSRSPATEPDAADGDGSGAGAALYSYALPLRKPLATGRGPLRHRRGLLVRLRDGDGRAGWGEAAPLAGWHGPDLETTAAALARWLRTNAPGEEPETLAARAGATLRDVPCAWAAVAGAAADLAARRRGVSLASFLAGPGASPAGPVPSAALVAGETPESVAASAAAATVAGHRTLKLKVASGALADDVARVAALRQAAPGAVLRLDANGAWGAAAGDAVRALARFEPELLEEPVRGLAQLRRLQEGSDIPIAADESLPPLTDLHRHLPLGVAAAILKPSALGDPVAVLGAAAALAETGTSAIMGSFMESAVGVATTAHVAAVVAGPAAGLGTSALLRRDVCEPPAVRGGSVQLPAGPGLGLAPEPAGGIRLLETFG